MLVDYSDSESESEQKRAKSPLPLTPPKSGLLTLLPKPKGARKNAKDSVEDNGPKKIIVNLPKHKDDDADDGPPAKKARIRGGSGLSAMLPAPKRSGATIKNAPQPQPLPLPPAPQEVKVPGFTTVSKGSEDEKLPLVGNGGGNGSSSTRFVPQSLARKPIQPASSFKKSGGAASRPVPVKPKVSLFGAGMIYFLLRYIKQSIPTYQNRPKLVCCYKIYNKNYSYRRISTDNAHCSKTSK